MLCHQQLSRIGFTGNMGKTIGIWMIYPSYLVSQLITAWARKQVNFQLIFQVPAAAMKSRIGVERKFLQHFVARPILGKVTKAFQ